ncbi:hypothetical protein RI129_012830 [Pyrocoelia pectoralis]|uniref:DUF4218 domain-containing protein n=1 Tax=Pyrocoelia pectoralis TaxID=417401 RepID=A0AAN7UUI8_9COLE
MVNNNSSDLSSSLHNDNKNQTYNLTNELRQFAVRNKVPHSTITDLLHVLHPIHPELPLHAKTLLKTSRTTFAKKQLNNGEYIHFGIKSYLKLFLTKNPFHTNLIKMSFNIDGIPLFKSSSTTFWPILGLIINLQGIKQKPFAIGVFCGTSKPAPLSSFLEDFISELSELCTKSHGGYSSCDKCTVEGEYINRRVVLDSTSAPRRTDESFSLQIDEGHHTGISPLTQLNIGMVSLFPIDYMHSVCLGVMKKLLTSWVSGYPIHVRLDSRSVNSISTQLKHLGLFVPYEFNRKPRSLSELPRYKATEFRTFLLYTGPIVLNKIIDVALYEHFMLLHVAATVLLSKRHLSNLGCDFVQTLMNKFIKYCKLTYGLEYLVYNVHTLTHLSEEANIYGPLDTVSAFPFENYLGEMKRFIRSPNKPLEQLCQRLKEANDEFINAKDLTLLYSIQHFDGPLIENYFNCKQYKKLFSNNLLYVVKSFSNKNSYCLTKNYKVMQISNIVVDNNNNIFFIGNKFLSYQPLFDYPCNSQDLNIYRISSLSSDLEGIAFNNIVTKCMLFVDANETWACFPLLH